MAKILPSLFLVFFLALFSNLNAQEHESISQLYKKYVKAKSDTSKVALLLKLGDYHLNEASTIAKPKSSDSAIFYIKKAEDLSHSLNYDKGIGQSYIKYSQLFTKKKQLEKAGDYAQKAIAVFVKKESKNDLAEAYFVLLGSKVMTDDPVNNLALAEKILKIYKETENFKGQGDIVSEMAYQNLNLGKVKEAQNLYIKALELYQTAKFEETQYVHSMIGIIYNEFGDLAKAMEYNIKALKITEKFNDESQKAVDVYNYNGIIYYGLKNVGKALENFQKAHKIASKYNDYDALTQLEGNIIQIFMTNNRKQEGLLYLKKLEKNLEKLSPMSQNQARSIIIRAYNSLKDYKAAEKYVSQSRTISDKLPATDMKQIILYPGIVDYYYVSKQYDLAKKYAKQYLALGEKLKSTEILAESHMVLSKIDSVQGNFVSSLANYKKQRAYVDSTFAKDEIQKIAELEIQYEAEKKDKDLLLKEQDNKLLIKQDEIQKSKLHQANIFRNIGFAGIFLLLLIIGLVYRRYKINQKIKDKINQKNDSLQKLVSDKEFLIKEIHHRVKNNLQIVMSLLNTQSFFLKDESAKAAILNSQHRIHSMSLIHKKLYQSENVVAVKMDIYIAELIEYFKDSFDIGQRIRFQLDIMPIELNTTRAVPLGLILNEAVINSIKHGFPGNNEGIIAIALQKFPENKIILEIKDNGIGSNENLETSDFSTLGMKLMKGFSGELNGKLTLESNSGFSIRLEFTYEEEILEIKKSTQGLETKIA